MWQLLGISPAPPPLWLVSALESDCDERSVLPEVEHSSTLGAEEKRPNAQHEKDAQRSARSWHFKKRGAPIENDWKSTPASGKKLFGGHVALSPVHTKHDNDKDNYNDNYICVHTSERYHLFILSARASAALNSRAHYSRMDSYWLSVFLSFISWKKIVLEVIPTISFLCTFIIIVVVWTLPFFNTENDF